MSSVIRDVARSAYYKFCPHCDTRKPRYDFHLDRNKSDGLSWICKDCRSRYDKERRGERQMLPLDETHANCGGLLVYALAAEPATEGYTRCEKCRLVGVPI